MTSAKLKPIIFTGDNPTKILRGQKTQTRRIIKHQGRPLGDFAFYEVDGDEVRTESGRTKPRPFAVGSRAYVKESWSPDHADFYPHFPVVYRTDKDPAAWEIEGGKVYSPESKKWFPFRWRSPLFMPRWASRVTLEVVAVRAERLHEISEADAKAEGCSCRSDLAWDDAVGAVDPYEQAVKHGHRADFQKRWNAIHGDKAWDANPWVWVIEFKIVPQEAVQQ